jgi:hypothetical protein
MAAFIIEDSESRPSELIELARNLPFNLDKLLSMKRQGSLFGRMDLTHLRRILSESGEYYRKRRQRGIRGRLASKI